MRNILKKTTSPHLPEGYRSEAAVLVVLNKLGQILLVTENTTDPEFGRKAGQYNLITETWKRGESVKQNVQFAVDEELGDLPSMAPQLRIVQGTYREADFGPESQLPSLARLVVLRFMGDPHELPFRSKDSSEIGKYQWTEIKAIDELYKHNQLAPSIYEYLSQLHRTGVIRPYEPSELHDTIAVRNHRERTNEDILIK